MRQAATLSRGFVARPGVRRVLLGTGAQVLSSVSTLILTLACASSLSADRFGIFALIFAGYALLVGTVRAFTSEILVFQHSGDLQAGDAAARGAATVNATISTGLACAGLVMVFAFGGPAAALVSLAFLPVMCLHDHARYALTATGRPGLAVTVEFVTFVVLGGSLLAVRSSASLLNFVVAWGVSELVAAALGALLLRLRLSLRDGASWSRSEVTRGSLFAGDFWATNGLTQATGFIAAAVTGVLGAGAIRAAQSLLTPVLLLTRGAVVAVGAESRRLARRAEVPRVMLISAAFSTVTVLLAVSVLGIVHLAGRSLIDPLLGESADAALDVLPWAVASLAATGAAMGPGLFLRAFDRVGLAFGAKLVCLPVGVFAIWLGTVHEGASGALAGLAASESLRAVINWAQVVRIARKQEFA